MIKLEVAEKNESKELYQWDLDRQIKITVPDNIELDEAHFAHQYDNEALVVRTKTEDGELVADIPNILLQSSMPIKVWLVSGDVTVYSDLILVIQRPKPADYVYTETEVLRFESLEARIKALENVKVDETLSEKGKAADAKATGDKISQLSTDKANVNHEHSWNDLQNKPFYEEYTDAKVIAEEQTVTLLNGSAITGYIADGAYYGEVTYLANLWDDATKGETIYHVYYNGELYECVLDDCGIGMLLGNRALYSNREVDTGEPFCIIHGGDFRVYSYDTDLCTLKIAIQGKNVKQLDEKFIPDSVKRGVYVIDSEAYTYGDDALQAILEGKQILIKVPNKNGGTLYSNFMPVLQYQLPNENNDYLSFIYLKDGIAENIMTAMATGSFDGVYGEITMLLSKTYTKCPLE